MSTLIKRAMLVAGVTTAMALPLAGHASDGTITFTGAITASTCTINVNSSGGPSTTVPLPTVDQAALTNVGPRTTAAGTFFSVQVSSCTSQPVSGGPSQVQIYFEAGPNVDQTTGGLINTTGGGSNVEVNLYNASGSTVVGTQILPGGTAGGNNQPAIFALPTTLTGIKQWFYAGYSTAGAAAAATAGAVSTSVTYSLIYS